VGIDERLQVRGVDAQVLAELHEGQASFCAEPPHEAH
jgi:hypothetical protein